MKRIWAAVFIALAMVILCGALQRSAKTITDELLTRLETLSAVGDGEPEGERMVRELRRAWDKSERKMSLYLRHSELEEVTCAVTRIESCWQTGEHELFLMACDEAETAVEHLWESSRLSLRNII